jgi:hypothetical protein
LSSARTSGQLLFRVSRPMPASLWSGNLRLSLVLIPVKLHSAVSTEEAISFRMIHEPASIKPRRRHDHERFQQWDGQD